MKKVTEPKIDFKIDAKGFSAKSEYKLRRLEGKRGQGDKFNPVVGVDQTPPTSARGLGLRKRRVDRTFTTPNSTKLSTLKKAIHSRWLERQKAAGK